MSRRLWVVLALAACERAAPVPPPPPPPQPPPADAAPRDDAAPPPIQLPAACRGSDLDVIALAELEACRGTDSAPVPRDVTIAITPTPVVVRSGHQLPAAIVVTNTGSAEVALALADGCGLPVPTTTMLDGKGERVDVVAPIPDMIRGCERRSVRFALAPGGTARLAFVIDARRARPDHDDDDRGGGNVPPGHYQLAVSGPLESQHVPITVE